MGLLCRRAKRTKSDNSEPPPEGSNSARQTAEQNDETEVLLIEDEGESLQLQRVLRPALSSDDGDTASITPLHGPPLATQKTKASVKAKRLEQRRRHLENIPGRLRRRLSREPRCPGSPSNTPQIRKHRDRSRLLSANGGTARHPSVLDHALGSGLVNENEYDSDAQCISTPKGSIQAVQLSSTKSSSKSPGSLHHEREFTIREESEQSGSAAEPRDISQTDNGAPQIGGRNGSVEQVRHSPLVCNGHPSAKQPSTASSVNEANGRQRTEVTRSEPPRSLSHDNTGPSSHEQDILVQRSSSSSDHGHVIQHKDSMSLMRARGLSTNKTPYDRAQSNDSSCTGDDALSAEIMKIQISETPVYPRSRTDTPSSFDGNKPPLSHFYRSQTHLRSLSEPDCIRLHEMNISKRLASVSADYPISSGDQLPFPDHSIFYNSLRQQTILSGNASTSETPRLSPSNNQRGRNVSSFYMSQTSSVPSNYGNSIDQLRLEVPAPSYSKDVIVLSKRHGRARGASRYSALPSDLFSPKGDSRTLPSNGLLSAVDDTVPQTTGTQSKFKEQFEPASPNTNSAAIGTEETVSRRVSVGWMSGGRRLGFGYAFVPSEGTEGSKPQISDTSVDDGPALPPEQLRLESRIHDHSKGASSDKAFLTPNLALPDAGMAGRPSYNDNCTESGEIRELSGRRSRQHSSLRAKTEHLWAKLPSHSRTERCGSATYSDGVIVRDFYSRPSPDYVMRKELGKEKRAAGAGKSRKFIRKWTRLYRPKSFEARRYRAGFTAEAAKYRQPKFPELQIPRGTSVVPYKEQLGDYKEEVRQREWWMKQKTERILMTGSSDSAPMQTLSTCPQQILMENERFSTETHSTPQPGNTGKENLNQQSPSTAQEWSRLYEDCVNIPADEIEQEQQPPISARDEGTRGSTSARGHLSNSGSDIRRTQVVEEAHSQDE
ncbi:hypothetical protein DTO169C6_9034 [Paecilomyces variotii]|nr:hypothetical protein DTO169C6_9034 [Paecilomyces variotii]